MSESSETPVDTAAGEPNPEPPLQPEQPIVYEPRTWYDGVWTCATNTCVNYNTLWNLTSLYSYDGVYQPPVQCGLCEQLGTVLSITEMDPQPPEE
ncbi:MAG TPA: hypothetical protein VFY14_14495 [Streptomyces sp.]|nr:hypothetical protein [Streptomyces sp.]